MSLAVIVVIGDVQIQLSADNAEILLIPVRAYHAAIITFAETCAEFVGHLTTALMETIAQADAMILVLQFHKQLAVQEELQTM